MTTRWVLAAILLVYLAFAVSLDRTTLPWCDEAWFASPGLNLAAKGYFGTSVLDVLYTPGHADGSVCFYNKEQGFVITGDVLFRDTIGRTDLPSGNFDLLMTSIREKIFTLPDDTVIYPGHGPETTIGYEKLNNPFIR